MLSHESKPCDMCGTKGYVERHTPGGMVNSACPKCAGWGRLPLPGTHDPRERPTVRIAPGLQPSLQVGTPTPARQADLAPRAVVAEQSRDAMERAAAVVAAAAGVSMAEARRRLMATAAPVTPDGGSPLAPLPLLGKDVLAEAPRLDLGEGFGAVKPFEDDPLADAPARVMQIAPLADIPLDPNDTDAVQSWPGTENDAMGPYFSGGEDSGSGE